MPRPSSSLSGGNRSVSVAEDEVDVQLHKLDGKIQRDRDEKLYVLKVMNFM